MALQLTCDCARGRQQLEHRGESTASEPWCSVSLGTLGRAYCSKLREIRTQDFTFPGCWKVLALP